MKRIVAATPADTGGGFGLAGIRHVVHESRELHDTLLALAGDLTTGVFIVDERLIDQKLQQRLDAIDRCWPGLVVVLPGPAMAKRDEEDYALRLIRRAIGYQVRLTV